MKRLAAMLLGVPVIAKWFTCCAPTKMVLLAPVMLLVETSVAVIVWLPWVSSVALNVPTPLLRVLLPGTKPAASLVVKPTVPP